MHGLFNLSSRCPQFNQQNHQTYSLSKHWVFWPRFNEGGGLGNQYVVTQGAKIECCQTRPFLLRFIVFHSKVFHSKFLNSKVLHSKVLQTKVIHTKDLNTKVLHTWYNSLPFKSLEVKAEAVLAVLANYSCLHMYFL